MGGIADLLNKVPFFGKKDYDEVRYEDPQGEYAKEMWPQKQPGIGEAPQASYNQEGEIVSYMGPFVEGENEKNLDKASVLAHEKLHKLWKDPEVWRTMPPWVQEQSLKAMKLLEEYKQTRDEDILREYYETRSGIPLDWNNPSGGGDASGEELYTRFMEKYYFPKGESDEGAWGDRVYFDKILKEHWDPYAKKFDELMKSRQEKNEGGLINLYKYGGFI